MAPPMDHHAKLQKLASTAKESFHQAQKLANIRSKLGAIKALFKQEVKIKIEIHQFYQSVSSASKQLIDLEDETVGNIRTVRENVDQKQKKMDEVKVEEKRRIEWELAKLPSEKQFQHLAAKRRALQNKVETIEKENERNAQSASGNAHQLQNRIAEKRKMLQLKNGSKSHENGHNRKQEIIQAPKPLLQHKCAKEKDVIDAYFSRARNQSKKNKLTSSNDASADGVFIGPFSDSSDSA